MDQAKTWFAKNGLHLNEAKTETLTFQMDRWEQPGDAVRLLGIYIDARLTWRSHIDHLTTALSRAIYAIRRTSKIAGYQAAKLTYRSLFESRMTYGIQIWGHSCHTEAVFLLQKRAVRTLTSEPSQTHCKPLFRRNNILTTYALYLLKTLTEVHNNKSNIPTQSDLHTYKTRSRNDLRTEQHRLTTTAHYSRSLRMYNGLREDWKVLTGRAFKKTLAEALLEIAPYSIQEFCAAEGIIIV